MVDNLKILGTGGRFAAMVRKGPNERGRGGLYKASS